MVEESPEEIPSRLLGFRVEEWRDPDDPVRTFLDDAHMRAFRRYRAARHRWIDQNGGLVAVHRLAEEHARRFPVVDPRRSAVER